MNDPAEVFLSIDETAYIWYPFIKTICSNRDTSEIHYKLGNNTGGSIGNAGISPFLEYVPEVVYNEDEEPSYNFVNVNPYFRFKTIFKDLAGSENNYNYDVLCDIIMHVLVNIDIICGMNRRDFLVMLIMDEMEEGHYGRQAAELFDTVEKRALAEILIMFYNTSDSLACLRALFRMILTDFQIILRDSKEFVFYNRFPFDEKNNEKIKVIIGLFLPIGFPYVIHWRYSYGYIGYNESMNCEEFVL